MAPATVGACSGMALVVGDGDDAPMTSMYPGTEEVGLGELGEVELPQAARASTATSNAQPSGHSTFFMRPPHAGSLWATL
jgi:hypothetical protein